MKRYVLTGAPGAGKTAIIRQLELDRFSVVEEAATDIIALWQAKGIAEARTHPEFIDAIVSLQQTRERKGACLPDLVQFHDSASLCFGSRERNQAGAVTGPDLNERCARWYLPSRLPPSAIGSRIAPVARAIWTLDRIFRFRQCSWPEVALGETCPRAAKRTALHSIHQSEQHWA